MPLPTAIPGLAAGSEVMVARRPAPATASFIVRFEAIALLGYRV
jgi:hypothetical protein